MSRDLDPAIEPSPVKMGLLAVQDSVVFSGLTFLPSYIGQLHRGLLGRFSRCANQASYTSASPSSHLVVIAEIKRGKVKFHQEI